MMPAYVAARELERRKAADTAECVRQLPLHAEDIAHWKDPETGAAPRIEPDWTTNY